jgi:Fic family protein
MRRYEETHPWISFSATSLNDLTPRSWILAGEARSKCEHLAGTPLKPDVARQLYDVYLIKGARATTAIEGNTLTEEQVLGIRNVTFKAPPSREYQEQEIRNMLGALDDIQRRITSGEQIHLSTELVRDFNRQVLKDLELPQGVVPGETPDHSVVVANYRGAPREDCEYLLDRLCEWIEGPTFKNNDPLIAFYLILAQAILSHLYLAWIHPFGDGNGRTARLVEFLILARCGMVPIPAAHLLSNHYNLTRDRYYRELDASSATGDVRPFFVYALEGFVDGIRDAINTVRTQQEQVAWVNYVHQVMGDQPNTKATDRQRALVLALPTGDKPVRRTAVSELTPKLARLYAVAGPRTLSRDLNHLETLGLVTRLGRHSVMARSSLVEAFKPLIADAPGAPPSRPNRRLGR